MSEAATAPAPQGRRAAARRGRPPLGVALAATAVAVVVLVPAAYLVLRASSSGVAGVVSTWTEQRTIALVWRTIGLGVAVTAAAVAIAVPAAWLTARTDLPGRRVWDVVLALPLVIPSYVGGFAFVAALGPRGLVQGWLEPLGVERLPAMYGFWGAWLVLTLFSYPYVFLTARAAIRRLDPVLEEASASLGHGRRATFRRVVLPQLRPAVGAGALLVALYAIHDFGAVSLLRFESFTYAIYVSYHGSFDRARAAALSLVLVVLALVIVAVEARTRGRASYHRAHAGASRRPRLAPLGRWRWPAFAGCVTVATLSLALPLGTIAYWLMRSARTTELASLPLDAMRSVSVSGAAAVVAVIAAWPVAVLSARHPGILARATERSLYVAYALPGIVVALSLVFFGIRVAPALYQSVVMLVFAYVVLFLPQATGAARASLLQVNPSLPEAARSLGSGRWTATRRVVLPLVRPGLVSGGALVFLTAMKELPATLLLAPTEFHTLATRVWSATSAAFLDRAAPPALALVIAASLPLALLIVRDRERLL